MNKKLLIRFFLSFLFLLIFVNPLFAISNEGLKDSISYLKRNVKYFTYDESLIKYLDKYFNVYYRVTIPKTKNEFIKDIKNINEKITSMNLKASKEKMQKDNEENKNSGQKILPNIKKAKLLLLDINNEKVLSKKIILLKQFIPFWESDNNFRYLANEDILLGMIDAIYDVFIKSVDNKDKINSGYLFDELIKKREDHIYMIEIQGTGHNLNLAYTYQAYIPYLMKVDFNRALKEAEKASALIDSPSFKAEVLLGIFLEDFMKNKLNLSNNEKTVLINESRAAVAKDKRLDKEMRKFYKGYIDLCNIINVYKDDKFNLYKTLVDKYMLAKRNIFAPIFPYDVFINDERLTSITDILEKMKLINEDMTTAYIKQNILSRIDSFNYLYKDDEEATVRGHYPKSDMPVTNKIYFIIDIAKIIGNKLPLEAKKLVYKAVELLPRYYIERKNPGLFYMPADYECLAYLAKYDYKAASDLVKKYKIEKGLMLAYTINWAPDVLYKTAIDNIDSDEAISTSVYIVSWLKDEKKCLDFFKQYTDKKANINPLEVKGYKNHDLYQAKFWFDMSCNSWSYHEKAIGNAENISDKRISLLTVFGILKRISKHY